jgi:transmembrane sensor
LENLEKLKITFYKYLNNELGEEDARQFLEHLQSGHDEKAFLLLIEENLDSLPTEQLLNKPELLALLNQSFAKVTNVIDAEPRKESIKLWMRMAASVAAVILVVVGFYFYNNKNNTVANNHLVVAQDIAPGKVGATLTLANGKKIKLSDAANGELAKEAGISVTKTADGELVYEIKEGTGDPDNLNTLTTAKGETYMLTLPDHSKVWMNAASSLTYHTSLNEPIRRVKLEGEAYFEVAEDKAHPFIVETREQEIEVLGTHFNVNSYRNEEKVTTTLLKGSVKVSNQSGSKILKPGNQSSVNENSILITDVETERAIAWKNNKFLFENDNIKYIMRMIERWYDVDVVYTGEVPIEKIGGGVSRFGNVSQVLKIIESTGGAHFKIEGRKISVSK